ncbi:ATP-binding protein [Rhizobium rhizogenes]|uniref:histidine kinase n=1 Tax=Rhizobium rhizogenes NBRC 13257 TaxID=1220581 RepID=A0AA87Q3K8_RHIRH|nr:ATP-binding protein [Rhizobium rhizogenes]NTF60521.1 PAS domain S-box protein [Rhizobium rhizogenes]NTF66962.1 PAS domain S-box protein [Rhizobium rhizogenes]NTF99230.1 PAS domain S-box protein [Rhizobium rhizogenes]NTG12846.1 PAS domain S-box protein [Rhizobium rhizogenes]NTG33323.1 PAS domain S-box protein [Rhizobium rhizogenes]
MPAVQYPFIDIAVHPRVRERFARGEAMVMFSAGMDRVLWANGAGANLFGYDIIYDFLDQGPKAGDVSFRQIEATARGLGAVGDQRTFLIRMASGFQRAVVNAAVEIIRVQAGEEAILFSSPVSVKPLAAAESAKRMIDGFDDPDTHMAVIGRDGDVIAASTGFEALGVTPHTAKMLTTMAGALPERLIKRPIPTGRGYLPAAVGKLSEIPALHLLFVVETVLGHLDPTESPDAPAPPAAITKVEPEAEEARNELEAAVVEPTFAPDTAPVANAASPSADVLDAVADIEEVEDTPEDDAAIHEAISVQSDAASEDLGQLATMDGASEEQIDAAAYVDELTDEADDMVAPAVVESPVEHEEISPEPAAPEHDAVADGQPGEFTFKRNGRATRFVWKIDAEGRFSEVSREFAEAVGPHAAKVTGTAFTDVAAHFNLDPDGKIAELLARRDTWSGRTIYWPVENTSLIVPVDLAALPTYTRSRDFDGFRGFGVVRLSDAIEDPMKLGLTLGAEEDQSARTPDATEEPAATETDATDPAITEETLQSAAEEHIAEEENTVPEAADEPAPANEEPPALTIAETPNRRETDKIIQLHERRSAMPGGLSLSEQAAFREIARQLEPFGKRTETPEEGTQTEEDADTSPKPNVADEILSGTTEDQPQDKIAPETDAVAHSEPVPLVETEKPAEEAAPDAEAPKPEEHLDPLGVLNTAIPSRVKMRNGLSDEIVDQLPLAILIHAGDRLIHGNPEFLRLTGYESLADLDHVGGLDALLQRHDLEGKTEQPGTMMVVRADDTLVPVTARLQSIRWEDGTALMLALMPLEKSEAASSEPVPEEARPERMIEKLAKLQVEIEELQSTLETATDGVVIIGQDGDIRSMNRSASALFNFDDQETRGKPFVMLFAHESQKAVLDYLSGLSGHGVASVLNDGREVMGREASGGFVPLFMTMGRLNSSNGYCAVIRDITQWKRTEEELRNAKRAAETANAHKTDFLARVSHEIRTPLNAIIGFSDMMAGERFGPIGHSRYIEYATDIGRSGRHVLDIVNDLLDISKIEAGEMDLEFASVGLNEAIAEAVSLVQPQANSQRVIIRTALSQAVPNVVADLRSIKQIALNILSNAIRFTPSGGQIVVSTSYEGNGSVVMRIRDTGVGMTRSELEQAMKPFRQVSTNSRKRGDGTGLGLPLTKAMVDANRATFAINSSPNEGTLVEVTFPSPRVLAN